MKKTLFISALVLAAIGSFAQGTINVGNGITATRFPIYGPQVSNGGIPVVGSSSLSAPTGSTVYTGGLLSGTRYAIEFWAGPSTATDFSGLTLIRSTIFRTAAVATSLPNGITTTIAATVPIVAAGMSAKLGVRVWDTQSVVGGEGYQFASIRGQSPTLFLSAPLGGLDGGGNLVSPNWVGQSFSLSCLDCYQPPMIFQHPLSATSTVGGNVNFFLTASYVPSYQWRKDGVNIAGAATNSLSLTNVTLADAGNYDVVLTNVVGSSTSAVATLTILLPPTISQPPQSQVVIIGSNASFSVTAAGAPTLTGV